MTLTFKQNPLTLNRIYTLEISEIDIATLSPNQKEMLFLNKFLDSQKISERLTGLSFLAERIEKFYELRIKELEKHEGQGKDRH